MKVVCCTALVPIMVDVDEPDDDSATLKVEHMFLRGELSHKVIESVREGIVTLSIESVEEVKE